VDFSGRTDGAGTLRGGKLGRINIGVLGANSDSGWARASHIPAIAALDNVRLAAVATSSRESAERAAIHFGAQHSFVGAEDLAASTDVDLVVVSIKAPEHERAVSAVLKAGKPVLCEWPLGANSAESSRLADLARARGLRCLVGLQGRFSPVATYTRNLLDDGFVGRIQYASAVEHLGRLRPQWQSGAVFDLFKGKARSNIGDPANLR
jgi:predicted dehydrogenase